MRILKNEGSFEILDSPEDLRRQFLKIERAGRTCYQSRSEITEETARGFVRKIMRRGHESVIEHASASVQFNLHSRGFCYDEKTEVLTRDGWKFFRDCDIEKDVFATLNPETLRLEYQKASERTDEEWNGPMYRVKSPHVDLLVTPAHRMFVREYGSRESWKISRAEEIAGKRVHYKKNARIEEGGTIPETVTLSGLEGTFGPCGSFSRVSFETFKATDADFDSLFRSHRFNQILPKSFNFRAFMRFLGFWLIKGRISRKSGGYRIILEHGKEPRLYNAMRQTLEDLGFNMDLSGISAKRIIVGDVVLYHFLQDFGPPHRRAFPRNIARPDRECSIHSHPALLRELLDACMTAGGGTGTVTTSSPRLADDLQEIALKVGLSADIREISQKRRPLPADLKRFSNPLMETEQQTCYVVSFIQEENQEPLTGPDGFSSDDFEHYSGMVRCVTVPNGILYVRRNGIPVWCGNTHEQVRHRLTAISQESTRYVDYAKFGDGNPDLDRFEIQCVVPPHCDENEEIEVRLPFINDPVKLTPAQMFECYEAFYRALRKHGYRPEDARQWLPIGLKSQIVISANFREWRHIFTMRTSKPAHWEIRRTMGNLLEQFQKLIPVIFDDFKVGGTCSKGVRYFVKDANHWRDPSPG